MFFYFLNLIFIINYLYFFLFNFFLFLIECLKFICCRQIMPLIKWWCLVVLVVSSAFIGCEYAFTSRGLLISRVFLVSILAKGVFVLNNWSWFLLRLFIVNAQDLINKTLSVWPALVVDGLEWLTLFLKVSHVRIYRFRVVSKLSVWIISPESITPGTHRPKNVLVFIN